jgi:hypothetical protein
LQLDREDPDQQHADQEGGQRHADQRDGHDRVRQPAARLQRRVDAEAHAEDEGEEARDQRQFQRRRQARQDQLHHRLLQPVGDAEIALHGAADEAQNCTERVVQPQRLAQRLALGQRRLLPDHRRDRVADEAEQRKRHQRHRQHDDDGLRTAGG